MAYLKKGGYASKCIKRAEAYVLKINYENQLICEQKSNDEYYRYA